MKKLHQITKRCYKCNKLLSGWDLQEELILDKRLGYESHYDLIHIKFQLCCKCFDDIMDSILPTFIKNPCTEYDFESNDNSKTFKIVEDNSHKNFKPDLGIYNPNKDEVTYTKNEYNALYSLGDTNYE